MVDVDSNTPGLSNNDNNKENSPPIERGRSSSVASIGERDRSRSGGGSIAERERSRSGGGSIAERERSRSGGGSIGSATKVEELRQLLLDATNYILVKLGSLKREIQSITTSEQMNEKKIFCDTLIEISKKLEGFPYGSKGYQPGKVPDECAFQPKLITFHNNMDLLIWENCSKVSIIEDFIHVSPSMSKMVIAGVTLQDVRKLLSSLPLSPDPVEQPTSPRSPRGSPSGSGSGSANSSPVASEKAVNISGDDMGSPTDSPKRSGRKETTLMLRSATGSVRGTKSQVLKEMEKVDDVITQRSQTLRVSQPSELFIEMMNEKASLIETNPLEFREKLLGIRRKGATRHGSVDQGATETPDKDLARKLKNRHNSDPPSVQRDTQAEKGGFHLLSLFIPPNKSPPPQQEDGEKSPFLSRTRSVSFFRQTGVFKLPSPDLADVPPIDLTDPSHRLIANVKGYRLDVGQPFIAHPPIGKQLTFLDAERDITNYATNFVPFDHYNYLGHDKQHQNPVAVSAVLKQVASSSSSKITFDALILIRTMEKDDTFTILGVTSKQPPESISAKKVLSMLKKQKDPRLSGFSLEEVADPQLKKALKEFEEKQMKLQYRMGVLYCKNGQLTEDEMYSNVEACPEFTEFLDVLGSTVELQDWTKFRGGLDVKGGTTGTHSVYTEFHQYQIMFHVSTMLPFQPDDAQRVERKRHLGNDVVLIVFIDHDGVEPIVQFDPSNIKSQFNHVFIVVQVDRSQPQSEVVNFKLSISCKDGVPPFGPDYPQSYSFQKGDRFRQFLLTKLINAERAALHAPIFAQKIKRTRKEALQMMYSDFCGEK